MSIGAYSMPPSMMMGSNQNFNQYNQGFSQFSGPQITNNYYFMKQPVQQQPQITNNYFFMQQQQPMMQQPMMMQQPIQQQMMVQQPMMMQQPIQQQMMVQQPMMMQQPIQQQMMMQQPMVMPQPIQQQPPAQNNNDQGFLMALVMLLLTTLLGKNRPVAESQETVIEETLIAD